MFITRILGLALLIVAGSDAATKSKCQIVEALRAQGVTEEVELRNWLCLADKESSFEYDAVSGVNSDDGSRDYGIFQLNSNFWCDRPDGTSDSTCWVLNTYGCQYACTDYTNSDISDDVDCAVRIKKCNGFGAWYGWKNDCEGANLNVMIYDPTNC